MTAFSVPNTSNRGCPSSLAGTTCRRDRSRISASTLQSTIGCRTDRSGRLRRRVTHLRFPHPSATVPAYGRLPRRTPTQRQLATGACSNFPTEPFPGLPIGDKRAFPSLTVSAPNSSQNDNSLQNRRDRRPLPVRPFRRSRPADRSPHHAPDQGFVIVFRETKTLLNVPICSMSRTPTSTAIFALFCHRAAITRPRHAPPPRTLFVISGRTGAFHQSVHRLFRQEADLPLFQLAHDPVDASPTKLKLLYTPRTAPMASIFEDLGRDTLRTPAPQGHCACSRSH